MCGRVWVGIGKSLDIEVENFVAGAVFGEAEKRDFFVFPVTKQ